MAKWAQGLGVSYSVDFDTFKELLQKIFKGKVTTKSSEDEETENEEKTDENLTPEYIGFKKSNSN